MSFIVEVGSIGWFVFYVISGCGLLMCLIIMFIVDVGIFVCCSVMSMEVGRLVVCVVGDMMVVLCVFLWDFLWVWVDGVNVRVV